MVKGFVKQALTLSLQVGLLTSGLFQTAFAQEYNLHINNFDDADQCPNPMMPNSAPNVHQLKADYLDVRYNTNSKLLTLEAEFNNERGKLPTGFHFALSTGDMPKGVGNVAAIYFDATVPSVPVVTAYNYNTVSQNCGNYIDFEYGMNTQKVTMGSWLTSNASYVIEDPNTPGKFIAPSDNFPGEGIFTTLGVNAAFVREKSVVDSSRNGRAYRFFRLVLDTTGVNSYDPLLPGGNAPYSWEGAQFGPELGLWFYAENASQVSYKQNGLLGTYEIDSCYICDFGDRVTNVSPACKSVSVSSKQIRPGDLVTAKVTGYDEEKDSLLINYSGQPSGSTFDVANNSILVPDANNEVAANFSWTPQLGISGKYTVNVQLTQQYGVDQAAVSCPFEFEVSGCTPTDWRETINGIDEQIDRQLVDKHINVLLRRIKAIRGKHTKRELELRARADSLGLEAWQTLFEMQRDRVIRQNCGAGISGCESIDTTKASDKVLGLLNELHSMITELIPIYRNVLSKAGIKGKASTRRWRPLLRSANNLRDNAVVSINSLPATVFACENF